MKRAPAVITRKEVRVGRHVQRRVHRRCIHPFIGRGASSTDVVVHSATWTLIRATWTLIRATWTLTRATWTLIRATWTQVIGRSHSWKDCAHGRHGRCRDLAEISPRDLAEIYRAALDLAHNRRFLITLVIGGRTANARRYVMHLAG